MTGDEGGRQNGNNGAVYREYQGQPTIAVQYYFDY
jgi:hypothetical protein